MKSVAERLYTFDLWGRDSKSHVDLTHCGDSHKFLEDYSRTLGPAYNEQFNYKNSRKTVLVSKLFNIDIYWKIPFRENIFCSLHS